eukprot:CAMPEP_0117501452 /NCGR_PEP_ID=MMETSP0784-20121206/23305_1 /TAXON_ID=39447 /ORGANISM="" /LENGTH=861 /DNA_ID=CAMNT_0005296705 /DNA_START=118 /DNA_END=2703 /DNA_ORIENTATION=-
MSHSTYQTKWTECMQELMEQVQIEQLPFTAAEMGNDFYPGFQHYALLYIKYLQIYKKLEDCADQMVHPQKRRVIKKVLRSTIVRILELKNHLIFHNPRQKNRFVPLDEVLTDLKLNPETVDWRVPRYFLDDPECREEIEDKQHKIDHWLNWFPHLTADPDPLPSADKSDPFAIGLTPDQAVEKIQKNERGRTGILRAIMHWDWRKETLRKEERQRRQAERGDGADDILETQVIAATRIAAHWKRKVDRKRFLRMRQDEFEFLGMQSSNMDAKTQMLDEARKCRERRKKMQEDADDVYQKALKEQLEWLHKKKGADIKADLLEDRRQWILDYAQQPAVAGEGKGGAAAAGPFPAQNPPKLKFPNSFDEFYQRFDKEEEPEEPVAKGKQAKGKEAKGKEAKKDKGGKGKVEEREEEQHDAGVGAVVQQFNEHINQYIEMWENKDETDNFDQRHDVELARKSVFPIVEAELRTHVDEMMKEELANLKVLFAEAKKKKPKKPKKAKKPKAKKPKKWCSAVGMVPDVADCVPYLCEEGILKKIKPCTLAEFDGEYAYLGATQRLQKPIPPPSAQMIRSLIVEHCVLPLAATDIRQKAPENIVARSLLLYGPKGTGKSMLARAIATETGATFFDFSPKVTKDLPKEGGKNASTLLLYKMFLCAQDSAPSVIYIDEVDQVFQIVKRRGRGDANAPSRFKKDLVAAIKEVKRGPESTEQDRILFIGCTSKPYEDTVDIEELRKAFDEKVWVHCPDYGSRYKLWLNFMGQHGVFPDPTKFNTSVLASVSEGYSAGSIKQTVDRVLTTRRVHKIKDRQLREQEFIIPLSRTPVCTDYAEFSEFDCDITGEKALQALRAAEAEKAEDPKGKK